MTGHALNRLSRTAWFLGSTLRIPGCCFLSGYLDAVADDWGYRA